MASPSPYPPSHAQVLVIGGGPSGSYAAAALAREGLDVVLLEAATFPRYHIGESLIPSVRHHLKFIEAEHKVASHGFARKASRRCVPTWTYKREGYTDFVAHGVDNSSWNVNRSEFDHILLKHAQSCGVAVFQSTKVISIEFSSDRPVSATWTYTPTSASVHARTDNITFDYVIDASGRAGILSTRYLKNRHFNAGLKNVAMWGYWRGGGVYAEGTNAEGAPWFEALTDETGWAWFIPLRDGLTSVGVVRDQHAFSSRPLIDSSPPSSPLPFWSTSLSTPTSTSTSTSTSSARPSTPPSSPPTPFSPGGSLSLSSQSSRGGLMRRYMSALELAPGVRALLGEGGMLLSGELEDDVVGESSDATESSRSECPTTPKRSRPGKGFHPSPAVGVEGVGIGVGPETVRTASDYSYSASTYAGEGFRIVGDAGDPFFSSGVHLAMTSGLAAAASIAAAVRGDCSETEAADWHSQRVGVSYTRFLIVVLREDNFDRAFSFLRPVIQGNADLGPRLSEAEVQRALDFCTDLFRPLNPDSTEAVRKRVENLDLNPAPKEEDAPSKGLDSPARVVLQEPVSPIRTRPQTRKRSGTIDTVRKWLGKVRGSADDEEDAEDRLSQASPSPKEFSRRRGTVSGTPPSILKKPISPSSSLLPPPPSPSVPPMARRDIFDVGSPILAPSAIDSIVQRAHPPTAHPSRLHIDTGAQGLLPAPSIATPGTRRNEEAEETRAVLSKINARRVIHREHGGLHSLEEEALGAGFTVRLKKGQLGLVKVSLEGGSKKEGGDGSAAMLP
ncbi:FAD/NAD(P)-binding domain-containing protein [Auriscalpium vulgare]|uniref:FAD/NAD(P)-binding domain-containing protein n=1 Tax=Auriscalpium vulgare TaxID=40419 RepID=A0ACB8SB29_9AGAM|nr:FAD/NAD(P)-binding domain-containing protein [Auriscalpium vulgare]